jgi:hypothetical protein
MCSAKRFYANAFANAVLIMIVAPATNNVIV